MASGGEFLGPERSTSGVLGDEAVWVVAEAQAFIQLR